MRKSLVTLSIVSLLSAGSFHMASAETLTGTTPIVPGQASISGVVKPVENTQKSIDAGIVKGQVTAKDGVKDSKVSKVLSTDEGKAGGTIAKDVATKKEQIPTKETLVKETLVKETLPKEGTSITK